MDLSTIHALNDLNDSSENYVYLFAFLIYPL